MVAGVGGTAEEGVGVGVRRVQDEEGVEIK